MEKVSGIMKASGGKHRGPQPNTKPRWRGGAGPDCVMPKVEVIGGSAGGIHSLCKVLERLPGEVLAPLFGVIHMGEGFRWPRMIWKSCTRSFHTFEWKLGRQTVAM